MWRVIDYVIVFRFIIFVRLEIDYFLRNGEVEFFLNCLSSDFINVENRISVSRGFFVGLLFGDFLRIVKYEYLVFY